MTEGPNKNSGPWPGWMRPVSWLASRLVAVHVALKQRTYAAAPKAPLPVISVGNVHAGGTGKSPLVQALAEALAHRGRKPVVLSRGYGGSIKQATRVDERTHQAHQVGDEPLMMAQEGLEVIVGPDRLASAGLAHKLGFDLAVLDDGHQTNSISKDFSLLVLPCGFAGHSGLIPLGWLREPIATALGRADAAVFYGSPTADDLAMLKEFDLEHLEAHFQVAGEHGWKEDPHLLLTGIANPERVLNSAQELGLAVAEHLSFPDHHRFSDQELDALRAKLSDQRGLKLLTTAKDLVRLPSDLADQARVLKGRFQPQDLVQFERLLDRICQSGGSNS